jgi:hypothetical protein
MLRIRQCLDNRWRQVQRTLRTLLSRNINIFMFLVLIPVRGLVTSRAQCDRKDLVNLKKSPHRVSNPRPSGFYYMLPPGLIVYIQTEEVHRFQSGNSLKLCGTEKMKFLTCYEYFRTQNKTYRT